MSIEQDSTVETLMLYHSNNVTNVSLFLSTDDVKQQPITVEGMFENVDTQGSMIN